ncbi:hypothetical protein [Thermodesulfovibrio hydrogeniphilus]
MINQVRVLVVFKKMIKSKIQNDSLKTFSNILNFYVEQIPEVHDIANRCLNTERWDGNVVLMLLDAAITSTGLNYFSVVVPKVRQYEREFLQEREVNSLRKFTKLSIESLSHIFKNKRALNMAMEIANYLVKISESDKDAIRTWAKNSKIEHWKQDPVGRIKGVGLITFQYLRMMGGIDTIMPDKIVKRVINKFLAESGINPINNDLEFIREIEKLAKQIQIRPTELCFLSWLIESRDRKIEIDTRHCEPPCCER